MKILPKIKLGPKLVRIASHFIDISDDSDLSLPDAHIVQHPFIISKLSTVKKGKVLEVGCTARTNCLPAILAWQGWDVYGIDLREFKFKHPNFHFVKDDITHTSFSDNFFDYIYEVSVLEHIGRSGRYGVIIEDIDGDIKAVKEITRILKPEGRLLIIEAFGKKEEIVKPLGRIYDKQRLNVLFSNYRVIDEMYFTNNNGGYWENVSEGIASEIGSKRYNGALVLLELCLTGKI